MSKRKKRLEYVSFLGNKFDDDRYTTADLRSIVLNKKRTITKQIKIWMKKHDIKTPNPYPRNKWFFEKFIEINNLNVPSNVSQTKFLYDLYSNLDFELLGAKTVRPEITYSEWKKLKTMIFQKYGKICLKCKTTENIALDHIKPYSIYPELATDPDNLQPLCRSCNSIKGNRSIEDYRFQ
jgi:hypothetical protein